MKSMIELRPYQKDVIEQSLLHKEGVIVMSTGSGKTIVALEMIYRLGLTATVIVPKTALQQQFYDECVKWWGYTPGMINGGQKEIKDMTITTFQSLYDNKELLKELSEKTSVLFVDECQGAVTNKNSEVISAFNPSYLYGLTATPMREDGQTEAIHFFFGGIIAEFHSKQLSPRINIIRTQVDIPVDEYNLMVDNQIRNNDRNTLITGLTVGEAITGRRVLVLTKRIEHANLIHERLPDWDSIFKISSDDPNRNQLLAELKKGEKKFSIILGTTALLSVGVDVPSLDTLILACDMKGEVLTTQSAGRILRLFEGKADPKIIDLWDNRNPILHNQFRKRRKLYIEKGWNISGG